MKKILIIILAVFVNLGFTGCRENDKTTEAKPADRMQFVTIGTGGVTGVYYPTGRAISKMIMKDEKSDFTATVESTAGSVYNINAVMSGDLDFGIAQSDMQYQAYFGKVNWDGKAQTSLRSVFSIHPESVTLVVSDGAGINSIADLGGKRVNLGNVGSGQLQNAQDVLEALGMSKDDVNAKYIKAVEAPNLLQEKKLDAFFYTVGHPSEAVKEATQGEIKVKIIPITGDKIKALIKEKPYYAESIIEVKNYPDIENTNDIKSVGVKATLVTSIDMSDDIVYEITKDVFENLEDFKKLHPAYSVLTKENMLQGLSAPIHPGALKYYKEAGLDKFINPDLIKTIEIKLEY